MKRQDIIQAMTFAGFHEDRAGGTRLLLNSGGRVSTAQYKLAFETGRRLRAAGLPCGCQECAKTNQGGSSC